MPLRNTPGFRIVCLVDEQKEEEEFYKEAVTRALEVHEEENGQFYRGTLRSGQVLETDRSVVVLGDVNPGAQVISRGNVVILGCCMGDVYAGASGNSGCFAAALVMKPRQVRIGDKTARSAITKKDGHRRVCRGSQNCFYPGWPSGDGAFIRKIFF